MTTIDRCEWSDLPRETCEHCGAHPGNNGVTATKPVRIGPYVGRIRPLRVVPIDTEIAPGDERKPLRLVRSDDETCACGQPLHDNATGCSDCVNEMERILGDTPWLIDQLELAITGQRAKRNAGRGDDGLPWNDKASETLAAFRNELAGTVRILVEAHDLNWPSDNPEAMSRWLLCNMALLSHDDQWTDTLRNLRRIEGDTLRIVDNPPALVFLGWCKAETIVGTDLTVRIEECGGPVYARDGQPEGKCRTCQRNYDVAASREVLEKALDDQLVTAAEIAKLTTYLGIEQPRERVRKLIETWRKRKRIEARGSRDGVPTFRYGEVRPLLSMAYETRSTKDA